MNSENIKKLTNQAIEKLITALNEGRSETLTQYLAAIGRFHRYSLRNVMLIASQKPTATHVAGFHSWHTLGRFVKKGEKGIWILAPIVRQKAESKEQKEKDESSTAVGFRAAYVFDISQTDGQLSRLNMNAGFWDFAWPQFFMGLALGMLFVPLTTISMDPIPNHSMGNATSLFNLVRNLGGSVGIAAVSTIQARKDQMDINILGAHINSNSSLATSMMHTLYNYFAAEGAGPALAAEKARAALFAMVQQQASMISYNSTFMILGLLFLAMLPFIFLMKRPKKRSVAAH